MQRGRFDEVVRWVDLALAELKIRRPSNYRFEALFIHGKNLRLFFFPSTWRAAKITDEQRRARLVQQILLDSFYAFAEKSPFSWLEIVTPKCHKWTKTGDEIKTAMAWISLAQCGLYSELVG